MTLQPFNAIRRAGACWPSLLLAAGAVLLAGPARAVGSTVDVEVVERETGTTLQVYHHKGSQYVAGRARVTPSASATGPAPACWR